MVSHANFMYALLLTFLAGTTTGIGGLVAASLKKDNILALSAGLGFSAGMMIYISLTELLQDSRRYLTGFFGPIEGQFLNIAMFFAGMVIAAIIDKLLPGDISHNVIEVPESEYNERLLKCKLCRTGLFTTVILSIHHFPEGLATFMSSMVNITLGISVAIAIAIQNIPEGIAVALPIYYSTKSRRKAVYYALLSGMFEPIGAIVGYLFLQSVLNNATFGIMLALVAGIMVYISLDELLPMAREYGNGHVEILGASLGMLVMAISLALF